MNFPTSTSAGLIGVLLLGLPAPAQHAGAIPDTDVLMRALSDELERSMTDLKLEGLQKPYFIQYNVEDRVTFSIDATFGGLTRSDTERQRQLGATVRVGSMELDNTNLGLGPRPVSLPIDDNYLALRQMIWLTTDAEYKLAAELLARKQAYLKERKIEDRPPDFSPAEPIKQIDPSSEIAVDRTLWENHVRRLSAEFKKHQDIEDSSVSFWAGAVNAYIVNSEGTRYRKRDTGIGVTISAEVRGAEGMEISDRRIYLAEQFNQLPSIDAMLSEIDRMCADLRATAAASMGDHYSGPVLFSAEAAGEAVASLLAGDLASKPVRLGGFGSDDTMEKKIGLRILPRSFQVYDDPREKFYEKALLAGSYLVDDEGVPAQRVTLVENGILKTLVGSRTPSRKIRTATGHGRGRLGSTESGAACLFIEDKNAIADDQLIAELVQAAKDEGLEYGLYVKALSGGGFGSLSAPLYAYKVYVGEGRQEPVRGLAFLPVEMRSLKYILAAGTKRAVYNSSGSPLVSVVAPALLFEELELTRVEQQFDTLPILKSPAKREKKN